MSIFIKAGLWLEKKTGYKGEFNLTKFVENLIATSPSGQSYKVYTALLSHGNNTSDPTVIVLENTLGSDIVWKRSLSEGIFYGQNSNFSDATKVWISFSPNYSNQGYGNIKEIGSEILLDSQSGIESALWFTTMQATGAGKDDFGTYIPVEIKVYN